MIRHLMIAVLAAGVLGTSAPQWLMVFAATVAMVNVLAALAHE